MIDAGAGEPARGIEQIDRRGHAAEALLDEPIDPERVRRALRPGGVLALWSAFAAAGEGLLDPFAGGLGVAMALLGGGDVAGARQGGSKKNDIKILNFALTLEYLEAAFYAEALAQGTGKEAVDPVKLSLRTSGLPVISPPMPARKLNTSSSRNG